MPLIFGCNEREYSNNKYVKSVSYWEDSAYRNPGKYIVTDNNVVILYDSTHNKFLVQ